MLNQTPNQTQQQELPPLPEADDEGRIGAVEAGFLNAKFRQFQDGNLAIQVSSHDKRNDTWTNVSLSIEEFLAFITATKNDTYVVSYGDQTVQLWDEPVKLGRGRTLMKFSCRGRMWYSLSQYDMKTQTFRNINVYWNQRKKIEAELMRFVMPYAIRMKAAEQQAQKNKETQAPKQATDKAPEQSASQMLSALQGGIATTGAVA